MGRWSRGKGLVPAGYLAEAADLGARSTGQAWALPQEPSQIRRWHSRVSMASRDWQDRTRSAMVWGDRVGTAFPPPSLRCFMMALSNSTSGSCLPATAGAAARVLGGVPGLTGFCVATTLAGGGVVAAGFLACGLPASDTLVVRVVRVTGAEAAAAETGVTLGTGAGVASVLASALKGSCPPGGGTTGLIAGSCSGGGAVTGAGAGWSTGAGTGLATATCPAGGSGAGAGWLNQAQTTASASGGSSHTRQEGLALGVVPPVLGETVSRMLCPWGTAPAFNRLGRAAPPIAGRSWIPVVPTGDVPLFVSSGSVIAGPARRVILAYSITPSGGQNRVGNRSKYCLWT